jgi:hypothetical protein
MSREAINRPHPFDLMFSGFRSERLPAIRTELRDDSDINAFLLAAHALELMRELRPDEGLGDAVDDFVAFVHAAYLFWRDGEHTIRADDPATRQFCRPGRRAAGQAALAATTTLYIQIAPRLVWGQLAAEGPFEPLDGWFTVPGHAGLRLVACFGVHAQRPGVSVVTVEGPLPATAERADGTAIFAPTMPGGDAAHLFAVSTPDELLLLGWRAAASEEIATWP